MNRNLVNRKLSSNWVYIVIALAALVVSQTWFRSQSLIWGNDGGLPFDLRHVDSFFKVFDPGVGAPDARKLPFLMPWGLIFEAWRATGIPYNASVFQHALVFVLLASAGMSMAWLIKKCLPSLNNVAVLTGALVYTYNQFTLTIIWSGYSNLIFHNAFLPLIVGLWISLMRTPTVKRVLLTLGLWIVTLTPAYMTTPVALLDIAVFIVISALFVIAAGKRKDRIHRGMAGSSVLLGWLALSWYWIAPLGSYAATETSRVQTSVSQAALFLLNTPPFIDATKFAGFWGANATYQGSPYSPWAGYYNGIVGTLAFLIPALAIAGAVVIFKKRRDRDFVLMPALIALVTVLAGAMLFGTKTFGWIDSAKISLLSTLGLRDPLRSVYARFMPYIILAMAPLVAAGSDAVTKYVSAQIKSSRYAVGGIAPMLQWSLLYVIAVLVPLPLISGSFLDKGPIIPSGRITLPSDYAGAADILNTDNSSYTVVSIPFGANALVPLDWQNGKAGYIGIEPLSLATNHSFAFPDPSDAGHAAMMQNISKATSTAGSMLALNARFLVVHKDIEARYIKGQPAWQGSDTKTLMATLDRDKSLTRKFDGPNVAIYENQYWKPFDVFAAPSNSLTSLSNALATAHPLPYKTTSTGFRVDTSSVKPGEAVVLNRPADSSWGATKSKAVNTTRTVTAFVPNAGSITISHGGQRKLIAEFVPVAAIFVFSLLFLLGNWLRHSNLRLAIGRRPLPA